MNRTSQELEAKIVQRYQDGLSIEQVVKELSVTQGTTYRVLKRNGVTLRYSNMLRTPDNIEAIRQMSESRTGKWNRVWFR